MDDEKKPPDRRESLSISAILNDEPVDPKDSLSDAIPDQKRKRHTWPNHSTGLPHIAEPPIHPSDDSMNMVPAPSIPMPPPSYVTTHLQQSKPSNNQILVPEEATVRHLNDGIVVCGIAKGKRKRISPEQLKALLEIFQKTDTPSSEVRERLAEQLNMSKREVQVWFQNRRAKASRMKGSSKDSSTERSLKHRRKSTSNSSYAIPNTFVPPPFPANPALLTHHRPRRYSAIPVLQTVARPFTNIQSLRPSAPLSNNNTLPTVLSGRRPDLQMSGPPSVAASNSLHQIAPKPVLSSFNRLPPDAMPIPPPQRYLHSGMGQLKISESHPETTSANSSSIHMLASAAELVSSKNVAS